LPNGQLLRESSKSDSKTIAKDAERARRRELEQAYNRIPKRERVPLFSHAADVWLANKAGLAPKSKERYEQCVAHLKEEFGKGLVCDVDANDIAEYRRKRLSVSADKRGISNRTVNYEVGALRGDFAAVRIVGTNRRSHKSASRTPRCRPSADYPRRDENPRGGCGESFPSAPTADRDLD